MPLGPKNQGAAPPSTTSPSPGAFAGASNGGWYESFIKQGVPEPAARTAAGYIEKGIDPAIALHITYNFGLDKEPESEWDTWAKENPGRATAKKLMHAAGSGVAAPVNLPDAEKLSAAKMLKEYLQHRDVQRAEEAKKGELWNMIHSANVQDQFFTQNTRPPQNLSDFAMAGMNYRPQQVDATAPQLQIGQAQVAPVSLPPVNLKGR